MHQSPPQIDWLKVNVNAAWKEGRAGLAFIIRDSIGSLVYLEAKVLVVASPQMVKTYTLEWAIDYVEKCN